MRLRRASRVSGFMTVNSCSASGWHQVRSTAERKAHSIRIPMSAGLHVIAKARNPCQQPFAFQDT